MRRLWRRALDEVTPYEAGRPLEALQAELGLTELVRLSANENPLGPSPRAVAAIHAEAHRAHLYPDGGGAALRAALARTLGVAPESVLLGNGADEVITLIAWAVLEAGDEAVVPHPAFEPYATVVTLAGARVIRSPLAEYRTDLDDMARRVTARTKAVFLCSPHNPAGTIIQNAEFRRFVTALGDDPPLLVLDEAYRDFADHPECTDGIAFLREFPTLIVLRTFSKIAGLAGLRIGYAVGEPEAIAMLNRVRAPYNVNRLALAAALAALEDRAHWAETRRLVIEERRFLTAEMSRRGLGVVPSQANFLLVKVGERAPAIRDALLQDGLLVRDGTSVGFPEHLRITISTRATNLRLLQALERAGPPP